VELKQEASDLLKAEALKLSIGFTANFSTWNDKDKELAKRLAALYSTKPAELNAEELLEFSAILDEVSEMSANQSKLLNEFKNAFFDSVENILTKAGEIASKVVVGALIALI
jgi:hypothetical protein